MTLRKSRTLGIAVGAALSIAVLVLGAMWALRPGPPVEYPADPRDQPPALAAFDTSTLLIPGCPVDEPDEAPTTPGKPGEEKLVEWGAVRLVRCTYVPGANTYGLGTIDVIEDQAKVTDAVRVLRRMLTTVQFEGYFGPVNTTIRVAAAFPYYRYLFQFPDGHITEVDYRHGYHRDGILRHRWSVRGTSVKPLAVAGIRTCGARESLPCQVSGTMATIPA